MVAHRLPLRHLNSLTPVVSCAENDASSAFQWFQWFKRSDRTASASTWPSRSTRCVCCCQQRNKSNAWNLNATTRPKAFTAKRKLLRLIPPEHVGNGLSYTLESTYHCPLVRAWGGPACIVNPALAVSFSARKTDRINANTLATQHLESPWPRPTSPPRRRRSCGPFAPPDDGSECFARGAFFSVQQRASCVAW